MLGYLGSTQVGKISMTSWNTRRCRVNKVITRRTSTDVKAASRPFEITNIKIHPLTSLEIKIWVKLRDLHKGGGAGGETTPQGKFGRQILSAYFAGKFWKNQNTKFYQN